MPPCHIEIAARLYYLPHLLSSLHTHYLYEQHVSVLLCLFLSVSLHIAFFILCAATHSPFVSSFPLFFASFILSLSFFPLNIQRGKERGEGETKRDWVRSCEWKRNRKKRWKAGRQASSSLCPEAAAARAETDTEAAIALGTRQLACIGLWETSRREARGMGKSRQIGSSYAIWMSMSTSANAIILLHLLKMKQAGR